MRSLFLLFIVMPIIEIFVLIQVGQAIGAWWTIALILVTAIIGISLLKQQGITTLGRAQTRIRSGELPAQEMIEGIMLAVGGALLLTPGFITDIFGFSCLLPFIRKYIAKQILTSQRFIHVSSFSDSNLQADQEISKQPPEGSSKTIEGEFIRHK